MEEKKTEDVLGATRVDNPRWFEEYVSKTKKTDRDLLTEIKALSEMSPTEIKNYIGGDIKDLPYETLETLFIDGSDNKDVVDILHKKRDVYIKIHPEKQIARGASEGIIGFDGRVIPVEKWSSASDSEKRNFLVGATCFHLNSDTPGMDSSPNDRF